ncbi:hypothetical protein PybrP1_011484 [[Pythium] brassicae (nom. inval.)]|nr:hypothetical protein PybrP1_011484 [[Pythium] brassicae (nom. inval.)]
MAAFQVLPVGDSAPRSVASSRRHDTAGRVAPRRPRVLPDARLAPPTVVERTRDDLQRRRQRRGTGGGGSRAAYRTITTGALRSVDELVHSS